MYRLATLSFAAAFALALITTPALAQQAQSNAQAGSAQSGQQSGTTIGTYTPRQVFSKAGYRQRMQQQLAAQQQQSQGQNQTQQQRAQQARAAQQQIIDQFRQDIQTVVPNVAESNNVDVVIRGQVVYSGDSVQTQDITPQVVQALNARNNSGNQQQQQNQLQIPTQPQNQQGGNQ